MLLLNQNQLLLLFHLYLIINFEVLNLYEESFLNDNILLLIIIDINNFLLIQVLMELHLNLKIFLNHDLNIQKLNIIFFLHELNQ